MTELPAIPQIDSPAEVRRALRETAYPSPTFGAAPGYLQCNLLVLPHGLAREFSAFCAANPRACPLIFETAPGQWSVPELGADIDLRTDLGSYRMFRDGQAVADLLDLEAHWQGDFVTFLMGSSFGLEPVLAGAGIETPYLARGEAPAHYITATEAERTGTFRGPLAVTMRPLTADGAAAAETLCDAYPHLHGAPLAVGDAADLGIESLDAPVADVGRSATVHDGEVPVFWASALTAQLALSAARLPFCIANTPGHLLVTDVETDALRQDDADGDEAGGDPTYTLAIRSAETSADPDPGEDATNTASDGDDSEAAATVDAAEAEADDAADAADDGTDDDALLVAFDDADDDLPAAIEPDTAEPDAADPPQTDDGAADDPVADDPAPVEAAVDDPTPAEAAADELAPVEPATADDPPTEPTAPDAGDDDAAEAAEPADARAASEAAEPAAAEGDGAEGDGAEGDGAEGDGADADPAEPAPAAADEHWPPSRPLSAGQLIRKRLAAVSTAASAEDAGETKRESSLFW